MKISILKNILGPNFRQSGEIVIKTILHTTLKRFSTLVLVIVTGCWPLLGQATESRPEYGVRLMIDQHVPMEDGVQLSADIYLPDVPGKWPALLILTPYNNMTERNVNFAAHFAVRGYAVVMVDLRGRHDSGGVWDPYVNDPKDGYDTQQWIGEQEWSDGNIGTWGTSYVGFTSLMPAPYQSPYLKAMVPSVNQQTNFGHLYNDGVMQLSNSMVAGFFWAGHTMQFTWGPGVTSNPLLDWDKYFRRLPLITALDDLAPLPWYKDWIRHSTYDDYWKSYGVKEKYDQILAPAHFVTGWYDNLIHENFRNWVGFNKEGGSDAARNGTKLLVGPWPHNVNVSGRRAGGYWQEVPMPGWVVDFGPDYQVDMKDLHLRWYDYWLKGMDNGLDKEAPIRIFVMRANKWRDEWEWPLARTEWTKYYLNSGGSANSLYGKGTLSTSPPPAGSTSDTFVYDPAQPVESMGGQVTFPRHQIGPLDRQAVQRRQDVLVFTSEPLTRKIEITGPIDVKLYAASDAVDTDFTATLTEVLPDGRAALISQGIVRASFRESLEHPSPIEPGKVYEYTIHVWETSWEFQPRSRIRLEISSSDFPRWARNLNTGAPFGMTSEMRKAAQTIFHDPQHPSHVILPVIP